MIQLMMKTCSKPTVDLMTTHVHVMLTDLACQVPVTFCIVTFHFAIK